MESFVGEKSIFRSELMRLCQFFLSSEAAYNCVSELGELGMVQFRDLNQKVNSFQRKFVNEVRRCDEMERKLRYIENQIVDADIEVYDGGEDPEAPQPKEMVDLEATFEKLENELREVNANSNALDRNFLELTELKHVLECAHEFLAMENDSNTSVTQNLLPEEARNEPVQLAFIAGVIPREKVSMFERMLWRVSRGNAFLRQQDIPGELKDPATGNMVRKSVYLIFFQGEQLKMKVKKICEGCRSTLYPCPEGAGEREEMLGGVKTRLADLTMVLSETTDHRQRVLAAAAKHIRVWLIKVRKIKGIYHTLNLFNVDVTNKLIIAEGWVPLNDMDTIKAALTRGTERSGGTMQPIMNVMDTKMAPPTFHRTNKFTRGFQVLIEAYGVPTYREVNPGLYTCATFPFLFAVMFGDLGHGALMFAFGLFLVLFEEKLKKPMSKNEITNIFYGGRYIVLLMGIFSMYTGFIYNDIFSKSLNIFGSAWSVGPNATDAVNRPYEHEVFLYALNPSDPEDYRGDPYWMGLDPIWQIALNKINFLNSYKMKISIIFGVVHMMFGLSLSLVNHLFFQNFINIFCEFIPQVFFLMSLFGYLCFLCFYKWIHYGDGPEFDAEHGSYCAPAVLILFINMMLNNPNVPAEDCESAYMFAGQETLQKVLVLGALLAIPVLLLPKPFLLRSQHRKKMAQIQMSGVSVQPTEGSISSSQTNLVDDGTVSSTPDATPSGEEHVQEEEFEMSEVFIHQAIHTIEFALGCVSHTASYLRLWALSLAHAQLSEVLWMMVLKIGLAQESTTGCIMLYLIFAAWAFLTVAILVIMEGLSAFLHTLRLHWVEFCSKFYDAQGYLFTPFAFKNYTVLKDDD